MPAVTRAIRGASIDYVMGFPPYAIVVG